MKHLLLVLLVAPFLCFSQCPIPDLQFNTQADVDAFISNYPDCTSAEGIRISGNDITDLSGLDDLDWVYTLIIENNPLLVSLGGLGTLQVETLIIQNNLSLTNFDNFNYLSTGENFSLSIENNPNLTDLTGFGDNAYYWDLYNLKIKNNPNLSVCNNNLICNFFESYEDGYSNFVEIQNNADGCNSLFEIENACGVQPDNDDCFNVSEYSFWPVLLEVGETIQANDQYATTSNNIPTCNEVTDRRDVWFIFNSGTYTTIDVLTQSENSLQLWEYGPCDNLTSVAGGCGSQILSDIPVIPNTYYLIQVWNDTSERVGTTPPGWFNLTVQDGALSTEEYQDDNVQLFPNPVKDELHITSGRSIDRIEFYTLLGQEVMLLKPMDTFSQINLSNLSNGIYLVKVVVDGNESIYKIVKE